MYTKCLMPEETMTPRLPLRDKSGPEKKELNLLNKFSASTVELNVSTSSKFFAKNVAQSSMSRSSYLGI